MKRDLILKTNTQVSNFVFCNGVIFRIKTSLHSDNRGDAVQRTKRTIIGI